MKKEDAEKNQNEEGFQEEEQVKDKEVQEDD